MTITMTPSQTTAGSDFAVLSRRITGEGLMQRRPAYYIARLSVVTLMLLGGWTAFFVIGSSWWQLVTAAFLAITFTQVALVAHDLAHRQVFRTKRGLPAQAGADLPHRPRRLADRRGPGRPELPDRAPPVPRHADPQPAQGPADRAGILRRNRRRLRTNQSYRLLPPTRHAELASPAELHQEGPSWPDRRA